MRVLVTRPRADAGELMARLEALGAETLAAPLIDIAFEPIADDAFDGAAGLIATSSNAIRALEASGALGRVRTLPVFAVGGATARRARDAGFSDVIQGPGTAADLSAIIAAHPLARRGPLVQIAGDHLAFDLEAALAQAGVTVRTLVVYRSIVASRLPTEIEALLAARHIDAVILMSPRTARTWVELAAGYDLSTLTHICISSAAAAALSDGKSPSAPVVVAARPTMEDVVARVEALASQSRAG